MRYTVNRDGWAIGAFHDRTDAVMFVADKKANGSAHAWTVWDGSAWNAETQQRHEYPQLIYTA